MPRSPTAAVIGAGSSGMAGAERARAAGYPLPIAAFGEAAA
jgi:cation diffusion facilitator CzcD-associated flavoprotein CzcO